MNQMKTQSAYIERREPNPAAKYALRVLEGKCDQQIVQWFRSTNATTFEMRYKVAREHLRMDGEIEWVSGEDGDLFVVYDRSALQYESDPIVYSEDGELVEDTDIVEDVRQQLIQGWVSAKAAYKHVKDEVMR